MKEKKIAVKIPPHGSLGLLAIGHRGVIAWRKAREEAKLNEESSEKKEEE